MNIKRRASAGITALAIFCLPYNVYAGTLQFDGVPVDITTTDGEDLVMVPGTGGNVQIGDGSGSNLYATTNDDLHVTGAVEVNAGLYADGGILAGSDILPAVTDASTLGSATKLWKKLYATDIETGNIGKINAVPYVWPSSQGAASTYLRNDGAGNLTWVAAGAGSSAMSSITPATATNTIDNSTYAQIWRWNLAATGNTALTLNESSAATTGGKILSIATAASSTATPLTIDNLGDGPAFVVNDQAADTTPFTVADDGNVGVGTTDPAQKLEVDGAILAKGTGFAGTLMSNTTATTGRDYSVYSSNAGNLVMGDETAGFARVVLDANGNLGIGATVPDSILDVNGAATVRQMAAPAVSPANQGRIYFDSTDKKFKVSENGIAYVDLVNAAASSKLNAITDADGANTTANGDFAQNWNFALTTADKDAFTFGETTAATGGGTQSILKATTLASSTAVPLRVTNLGSGDSLRVNDETGDSDTTPFIIAADGNVGVGTASPAQKLHVSDSANGDVVVQVANANAGAAAAAQTMLDNGTTNLKISKFGTGYTTAGALAQNGSALVDNGAGGLSLAASNAGGAVRIYTGGTGSGNERLYVSPGGAVGIGTNNPQQTLAVEGTLGLLESGSSPAFHTIIRSGDISSGADILYTFPGAQATLAGQVLTNDGSGNLSWANVATGSATLDAISAAVGSNTIGSANNDIVWNWALSTASKSAFTIGESAASINGSGSQSIMKVATLGSSTAMPLWVLNEGNAYSLRVDDVASDASPFIVAADGNVGIGTTAAPKPLSVNGQITILNPSASGGASVGYNLNTTQTNFTGMTSSNGSTRLNFIVNNSAALEYDSSKWRVPATYSYGWVPAADTSVASDTAIGRNAAGVMEINNGTAGQYRDIQLRNANVDGALNILETGTSPSFHTIFQGADQAGDVTYVLPAAQAAGVKYMRNDGAGNLSWADAVATSMKWNGLTDPDNNLALSMGANTSTFTYNATTGANSLFKLTDTTNNTGTGYLMDLTTASGSTLNPFRVKVAGVDALTVTAGGNVGIGTVTPANRLHVPWLSGDTTATASFGDGTDLNNNQIAVSGASYGNYGVQGSSNSGTGVRGFSESYYGVAGMSISGTGLFGSSASGMSGYFQSDDNANTAPTLVARQQGASTADLFQAQDDAGAALVVVKSTGNVGIGTTAATHNLTVDGTTRLGMNESVLPASLQGWTGSSTLVVDKKTGSGSSAFGVEAQSDQTTFGIYSAALGQTAYAIEGDAITDAAAGTAIGLRGAANADGAAAASLVSIRADSPWLANSGTTADAYGLLVQDVTVGTTNNFAIKTGAGKVSLGDDTFVGAATQAHASADQDLLVKGNLEVNGILYGDAGGLTNVPGGALSGLSDATTGHTLTNGDNAQVWNWELTTNDKDAFTFGETAASSATGVSAILKASTLAGSTATPFVVTNLGDGNAVRVNDETGDADATPFVINPDGNVGIGTTAPDSPLQVSGEIASVGAAAATLRLGNQPASAGGKNVFLQLNPFVPNAYLSTEDSGSGWGIPLTLQSFGGNVGIGDSGPQYLLSVASTTGRDATIGLSDQDVVHGVTSVAPTNVFFDVKPLSSTAGGAQLTALSDTDASAMELRAVVGAADPTDTVPAIKLIGAKSDGATGLADLDAAETVFQVANNANTASMTMLGNGNVGIGTVAPGTKLTVDGDISILESGASPSYHTIFHGGDQAGDITYTLPTTSGNGVLTNTGGALSWAAAAGGDITTVGNCTTGDCFDGTSGSVLTGNPSLTLTGGSTTTSSLTFKTTNVAGTTGADMHFLVGTNGATEAMTILNNGNVGVGTSAPAYTLDVRPSGGTANATMLVQDRTATTGVTKVIFKDGAGQGVNSQIEFQDSGGTARGTIAVGDSLSEFTGNQFASMTNDFSLGGSQGLFKNSYLLKWSSDATYYGTADAGMARNAAGIVEINNGTGGQFRDLRLRNQYLDGTLGILETGSTPTYRTIFQGGDQAGDITYTLPTASTNGVLTNTGGTLSWTTGSSGTVNTGLQGAFGYYPTNGTTIDDQTVLYTDGTNVGIGSSAPTYFVDINKSGASDFTNLVQVTNGTNSVYISPTQIQVSNGYLFGTAGTARITGSGANAGSDYIALSTANAERMRIIDNGNVGIGYGTPAAKLDVRADNAVTNAVSNVLQLNHSSSGTPAASFGTGLLLTGETSTTDAQDMARIQTVWTDATHASRTSKLQFQTVNNAGALASHMELSDGLLQVSGVGNNNVSMQLINPAQGQPFGLEFQYGDDGILWGPGDVDIVLDNDNSGGTNTFRVRSHGQSGQLLASVDDTGLTTLGGAGIDGTLKFYNELGATDRDVTIQPSASQTASYTLTLPAAQATSSGQVLSNDGSGGLSWATVASGSAKLNAVQAADGSNTIGNGSNAIVWNWSLGSTGNTGFTFGESAAATSGGTVLKVTTANGTTALPLSVVNDGTGASFRVDDVASDTTPFLIDAAGNVGVGTTFPWSKLHAAGSDVDTQFTVSNDTSTAARFPSAVIMNFSGGNGGGPNYNLQAGRGTAGSPAAVQSGDSLGNINAFGQYDTTQGHMGKGALISFKATGTFSSTSYPTSLGLLTTDSGSTTAIERLHINPDGNVGIGSATPGTKLTVDGDISILESGSSPSFHTIFHGGDQAGDITYTLPTASSNGVLTNTGGTLSWAAASGSGTVNTGVQGYFGYYPANGTTIDDQALLYTDGANVGIGTSNPGNVLDITTTVQYGGLRVGNGGQPTALLAGWTSGGDNGGLELYSGGVSKVLLLANGNSYFTGGNVGIGTATVGRVLETNGGTYPAFTVTGASGALDLNTSGGTKGQLAPYAGGLGIIGYPDLIFDANNSSITSQRVFMVGGGNVGIGINVPTSKLDVRLDDATTSGVSNLLQLNHSSSGTPANGFGSGILFTGETTTTDVQNMAKIQSAWTDATHASRTSDLQFQTVNNAGSLSTAMTVRGDGNVGIGTTGALYLLDVNGGNVNVGRDDAASKAFYFNNRTDYGFFANGSAYDLDVLSPGNINIHIDHNNNQTDRVFSIAKDGASGLFSVAESGLTTLGGAGTDGTLKFYNELGATDRDVTIQPSASQTASYTLTLPTAAATSNGQVLASQTDGTLSWVTAGGGSGTVNTGVQGYFGYYPANGTTIDDQALLYTDGTNIGIGTTTLGNAFHLNAPSGGMVITNGSANKFSVNLGSGGTEIASFVTGGGNGADMSLVTSNSASSYGPSGGSQIYGIMIKNTSGNVGIGTTAPASPLDVNGATFTPTAGASASIAHVQGAITEAGSGTHALLAGLYVDPPTITGAAATVTQTASLYIPSAPSATVSGTNYALYSASGANRMGGTLSVGTSAVTSQFQSVYTSTLTGASSETGNLLNLSDTGVVSSGTDTTIGTQISATRTGASGGTINTTALNVTGTGDTGGTSTMTGLAVSVSGADTNYAATFSGGNVGVGTTTPGTKLTVDGDISILESGSSPSFHTILHGGDQAGDITYTLPTASSNGVLTNTGGTLSWAAAGGSGTVNTGVQGYFGYYPANGTTIDDQTLLYTDGTNIAIGTTNPFGKLTLAGNAYIVQDGTNFVNKVIAGESNGTNKRMSVNYMMGGTGAVDNGLIQGVGFDVTNATPTYNGFNTLPIIGTRLLNQKFEVIGKAQTSGTFTPDVYMTVNGATGNVGIGSVTPSAPLDVSGAVKFLTGSSPGMTIKSVAGPATVIENLTTGGYMALGVDPGSNTLVMNSTDRVGIGTGLGNTVDAKLEIMDTSGPHLQLNSGDLSTWNFTVANSGTGDLTLARGAGTGDFVLSGMNVGIGTSTPSSTLTVYNSNESNTLTNFTQALTSAGINLVTDYTNPSYTPGLFWSTQDNNSTKPKAGIWLFEDSSGTRMYLGTSNNYATGIVNRVTVDYNGNIGIGTTTAGTKLTVDGDISILESGSSPSFHTIFHGGDQAGDITYTLPTASSNGVLTNTSGTLSWGSGSTSTLQQTYDNDADGSDTIVSLTSADDSLIFRNPAASGTDSAFLTTFDQLNTGAKDAVVINQAGTGYALRVNDDGTSTDSTPFVIDQSGHVGIGTTTLVGYGLEVYNTRIYLKGDGSGGNVGYMLDDTQASGKVWQVLNGYAGAGKLSFYDDAAGVNRLVIEATSGNIGIGTTAPVSLLEIEQSADSTNVATPVAFDVDSVGAAGELTASSGAQTFARFAPVVNQSSTAGYTGLLINATETATGSGSKRLLDLQTGGASKVVVQSDGNVGVGSTSPAYKLDVSGKAQIFDQTPSTGDTHLEIKPGAGQTSQLLGIEKAGGGAALTVDKFGNVVIGASFQDTSSFYGNGGIYRVQSTGSFGWSASQAYNASDTALFRNAAGIVEINNGTGGQFRDLRLRNQYLDGTLGILETGSTPTYRTIFQGGDQAGDITYTLPTASSNGVLTNTGGTLSWSAAASGDVTKVGDCTTGDCFDGTSGSTLTGAGGVLTMIGGTTTTSDLNLKTTTAAGAAGADMHFLVGNNGGTEAMTILNNGNVGIGSATPGQQVEIYASTGGRLLVNGGNSGNTTASINRFDTGTSADLRFLTGGSDKWTLGMIGLQTDFFAIRDAANGYATRLAIIPGGNIGIGTTAPVSLLEIEQSADSTNVATPVAFDVDSVGAAGELTASSGAQTFARFAPVVNQSSTAGYTGLLINATETATGSGSKRLLDLQTGGASKVVVQSDGNVGIGTTTPGQKLEIDGNLRMADDSTIEFGSSGFQPKIVDAGNGKLDIYNVGGATGASIEISGNEQMRFRSDGIGAGYQFITRNTIGDSSSLVVFENNGVSKLEVLGNGNVGIGSATPGTKLTVDGDISILESGSSPSFHTIFHGGDQAGDITYTLPTVSSNGVLTNTGGTLSWAAASGSGTVNTGVQGYFGYYPGNGTTIDDQTILYTDGTNIGIGTTTTAAKLHLYDTVSGNGVLMIQEPAPRLALIESDATTDNKRWQFVANNEQLTFNAVNDATSTSTSFMTVNRTTTNINTVQFPNGNVGIGFVSSPTAKLHVFGTNTSTEIMAEDSTDDDGAYSGISLRRTRSSSTAPSAAGFGANLRWDLEAFTNNTTANAAAISGIWEGAQTNNTTDRDGALTFSTMLDNAGPTERMRIKSDGNVGIGTSDPSAGHLVIDKNAPVLYLSNDGGAANDYPRIKWNTTTGSEGLKFFAGTSEVARIQDDGRILATSWSTIGGMNINDFSIQRGNTDAGLTLPGSGVLTFGKGSTSGGGATVFATEFARFDTNGNLGIGTVSPNSTLEVKGSVTLSIVSKTGAYTLTASDYTVLCDTTSAGFTITLPTAVGITGRTYVIKKTNSGTNNVTIDANGTQTIDGDLTKAFNQQNRSLTLQSDGANWVVI